MTQQPGPRGGSSIHGSCCHFSSSLDCILEAGADGGTCKAGYRCSKRQPRCSPQPAQPCPLCTAYSSADLPHPPVGRALHHLMLACWQVGRLALLCAPALSVLSALQYGTCVRAQARPSPHLLKANTSIDKTRTPLSAATKLSSQAAKDIFLFHVCSDASACSIKSDPNIRPSPLHTHCAGLVVSHIVQVSEAL